MNAAESQLAPLDATQEEITSQEETPAPSDKPSKRTSVIDRFTEKLKTFLESAE